MNKIFWATSLTGGGNCIDGIDGNDINVGDACLVIYNDGINDVSTEYRLQVSNAAENSPSVISPDINAGLKRWHRISKFPGIDHDLLLNGDHSGLYSPLTHKTTEDALNGLVFVNGAGTYSAKIIGGDVQAYHANLAAIAAGTWTGADSITTLGTLGTLTVGGTGLIYGHSSIGNVAAIDKTVSFGNNDEESPLLIQEVVSKSLSDGFNYSTLGIYSTYTNTNAATYPNQTVGLSISTQFSGGNLGHGYGIYNYLQVDNTNEVILDSLYGISNSIYFHRSSSPSEVVGFDNALTFHTTTSVPTYPIYGFRGSFYVTGPVALNTPVYQLGIPSPSLTDTYSAGFPSVDLIYGLYVGNQNVTGVVDSWNIYSEGATSKNYFGGKIGIGAIPTVTNQVYIEALNEQNEYYDSAVIYVKNIATGGNDNSIAIYGESINSGYGIGVYGIGDYGIIGESTANGGEGVRGTSQSDSTNYGGRFFSQSTAGHTAYGVWGYAVGGDTNWAGYFDSGNVYIKNKLGINSTPNVPLDIVDSTTVGAELRLREAPNNGVNYIGLKSPDSVSASITYELPPPPGVDGYVLASTIAGVWSWVDNAAGTGMSNPMTVTGDLIYGTTTGSPSTPGRLGIGTAGQVLETYDSGGGVLLPRWGSGGGLAVAGDGTPDGQIQFANPANNALDATDDFWFDNTNKELYVIGSKAGTKRLFIRNTLDGTTADSGINIGNDTAADQLTLRINASTFTTYGGYSYLWSKANAPMVFGVNDIEIIRLYGTHFQTNLNSQFYGGSPSSLSIPYNWNMAIYGGHDPGAVQNRDQYNIYANHYIWSGGGTYKGINLYLFSQTQASSFTAPLVAGLYIDYGNQGAGSLITNKYGIFIENQGITSTPTNMWGMRINRQTGGSNNYQLALGDLSGSYQTSFNAGSQSANINYTLPPTVGAAGTYLKDVAGDGVLSWDVPSGGTVGGSGTASQAAYFTASSTLTGSTAVQYVNSGTGATIQAAIDALPANGGTVYVSAGTYNATSMVNLNGTAGNKQGVKLVGAGIYSTTITWTGAVGTGPVVGTTAAGKSFGISGMTIDGGGLVKYVVKFVSSSYSNFDQFRFIGNKTDLVPKSINNGGVAVNIGGGFTGIPSTAHGFSAGEPLTISNTVNYNGTYVAQAVSADQVIIQKTYIAETFGSDDTIGNGGYVLYLTTSSTDLAQRNRFENFLITASGLGGGLFLGGNIIGGTSDWNGSTFISGSITSADTAYPITLDFCDSNTFMEIDALSPSKTRGVLLQNTYGGYPQNNFFYGCSIAAVASTGTPDRNYFPGFTLEDSETPPYTITGTAGYTTARYLPYDLPRSGIETHWGSSILFRHGLDADLQPRNAAQVIISRHSTDTTDGVNSIGLETIVKSPIGSKQLLVGTSVALYNYGIKGAVDYSGDAMGSWIHAEAHGDGTVWSQASQVFDSVGTSHLIGNEILIGRNAATAKNTFGLEIIAAGTASQNFTRAIGIGQFATAPNNTSTWSKGLYAERSAIGPNPLYDSFIEYQGLFRVDANGGLYVYVGGSLKAVTAGSVDSGGVGYRLLRVPN